MEIKEIDEIIENCAKIDFCIKKVCKTNFLY